MIKRKNIILICIYVLLLIIGGMANVTAKDSIDLIEMDSQDLQTQELQSDPAIQPRIIYQTHIQDVGWGDIAFDGIVSGTVGASKRLEAIKIFVEDYSYDLDVEYQTHIQNIGWEKEAGQGLKSAFELSGTSGMSYRLEGIKINLTGADADKFDIIYRTQIENVGWETEWKKNGEMSGTEGQSLKLEAIVIKIVPKGTEASTDTPLTYDMYENVNDGCGKVTCHYTSYVPWKVNFDNSNCQHQWEEKFWPYMVQNDQLLKYVDLYYNKETKTSIKLTPLYEADVANGCIYNFAEWMQGYGNSTYPDGITRNVATFYNLTADRWAISEEFPFWLYAYPAFWYCEKCGQTSLGGH